MSLFAYRPLVFISSAITSLETEREQTKKAIEATGLADAWVPCNRRGRPAGAQYLPRARAPDVFVLLIADSVSPATWQEYEVAYADDPSKTLAFLVGPQTDATKDKRAVLAERHAYKQLRTTAEIPSAVAAAVEQAVGSGALLAVPLDALVKDRIVRLAGLLKLPTGLELPSLAIADPAPIPVVDALKSTQHAVLTGPAGSGKTHTALQLLANKQDIHLLPIFVRFPGREASLWGSIAAGVRPVRFELGSDLLRQWARDGRLSLVFEETADPQMRETAEALRGYHELVQAVLSYGRFLASPSNLAHAIAPSRLDFPGWAWSIDGATWKHSSTRRTTSRARFPRCRPPSSLCALTWASADGPRHRLSEKLAA